MSVHAPTGLSWSLTLLRSIIDTLHGVEDIHYISPGVETRLSSELVSGLRVKGFASVVGFRIDWDRPYMRLKTGKIRDTRLERGASNNHSNILTQLGDYLHILETHI
ncbi:hypothetical protein BD311DRAFT_739740 [Dichomitus squalens]|uniref:Uncharacterized protein n=1 Tax=Dichomitus squalens TaxID=114155 RepID=A0A4Q9MLW1_9APHY|nr:hypothetical protein BD311DRAFT_739740 [Dichomitus squalens]